MKYYAASGVAWGAGAISLAIGVIGALLSLGLLFSIKPRLRLRLLEHSPSGELRELLPSRGWVEIPSPAAVGRLSGTGQPEINKASYSVLVENLGLGSVVEVEARLWHIRRDTNQPHTRSKIDIKVGQLLELPGKWREARRSRDDIILGVGDRFFRFQLQGDPQGGFQHVVSPETLDSGDRYLFHVWSKHGFTNFGRVHKLRIECTDGKHFKYAGDATDASRRPRSAPAIAAVAWIAQRRHIHRFDQVKQYPWPEAEPESPQKVVVRRCRMCQTRDAIIRVTYFAYGSNMAPEVIARLCPQHHYLGVACLDGYRLAFTRRSMKTKTGVADIVEAPGQTVWGVLYEIDDDELAAVDYKEGYGWAYTRVTVPVQLQLSGPERRAITYTVVAKEPEGIPPSREYLDRMIAAARYRGFPEYVVTSLEAVSTPENRPEHQFGT